MLTVIALGVTGAVWLVGAIVAEKTENSKWVTVYGIMAVLHFVLAGTIFTSLSS